MPRKTKVVSRRPVPTPALSLADNRARYQDVCRLWREAPKFHPLDLEVKRVEPGYGLLVFVAFERRSGFPVGHVFAQHLNHLAKIVMILDSHVRPEMRRKGVRSIIQAKILEEADTVVSVHGTGEGGEAWMRRSGYAYDPAMGWWICRKSGKRK